MQHLKSLPKRLLAAAYDYYKREPARATTLAASGLVAVLAYFDIVVDQASVLGVLGLVVPILLGGQVIRGRVVPLDSLVVGYDDIPDDKDDRKIKVKNV